MKSNCSVLYGCPGDEAIKYCLSFHQYSILEHENKTTAKKSNTGLNSYAGYVHKCNKKSRSLKLCSNFSCQNGTYTDDSINAFLHQCEGVRDPNIDKYYQLGKYAKKQEVPKVKSSSFIEDLLSIGIVIGGAYLLGTALTPAPPPPPATTTNIFTTIIQETPKQGIIGY